MYLVYLDESGDPNGWNNDQDHFVIGGVAVHEGQVQRLSDRFGAIQSEFFPNIYVPLNLHATEIHGGRDRYRQMPYAVRQRMLEALYAAIVDIPHPSVVPFATAIHISAVVGAEQALRDTFEDVLKRVNTFLIQRDLAEPQHCLLVIDRSQSTEDRYRALLSEMRRTSPERVSRIVDIPYFSQSSDTRLLQVADFCAHAVFRHYERGDGHFLNRIMPRANPDAPRDGLRYITRMPSPN